MKRIKRVKQPPRNPERPGPLAMLYAETTSGTGYAKILNAELDQRFGIPLSFLTENQWEKIYLISGLPMHARFEVNIALRRYWIARLEETIAPHTKEDLRKAKAALEASLRALTPLTRNEDIYKGNIVHFETSAMEQTALLEKCMIAQMQTLEMIKNAEDRLKRSRGRPRYGQLYDLIHHLDFVLYTCLGVNVTRSKNRIPSPAAERSSMDYVIAVLEIADRHVTPSTIDTVLKGYITDREKHGREFKLEMAQV